MTTESLVISSVFAVASLAVFVVSTKNLKKKIQEIYKHPEKFLKD